MIIDGKKISEEIIVGLGDSLKGKRLGIIVGTNDSATESFLKIKTRVAERLGVEVVRGKLEDLINTCDGIIVQLPHPDAETLIQQIPPEKDLDAIGSHPLTRTPVAEAIAEVFVRSKVSVRGKRAVVVGSGRLVGAPAVELLTELGAQVVVVTKSHGSLDELKDADIVVSGAGEPRLIKPEMLKQGVVLIDAGTSEAVGRLVGDAEPKCAEVASVFTPVPGGIGPIAVAMIFKNLSEFIKQKAFAERP